MQKKEKRDVCEKPVEFLSAVVDTKLKLILLERTWPLICHLILMLVPTWFKNVPLDLCLGCRMVIRDNQRAPQVIPQANNKFENKNSFTHSLTLFLLVILLLGILFFSCDRQKRFYWNKFLHGNIVWAKSNITCWLGWTGGVESSQSRLSCAPGQPFPWRITLHCTIYRISSYSFRPWIVSSLE